MNGKVIAAATTLEKQRDAGRRRRCAVPDHCRARRDAVPGDAVAQAGGEGDGPRGEVRQTPSPAKTTDKAHEQRPGRRVLGAAQQSGIHPESLTVRVRDACRNVGCKRYLHASRAPRRRTSFHDSHSYVLSRRDWLQLSAAGVVGYSLSGWLERLAAEAASNPQRKRSCILLWMNGGPSQMDTFDLKPGHANGGPFKEIATSVPGIKISEHLPKIAKHMDRHGHRPLDEHQGGRPRPGHLPDAHRLPARRPGPVSDARLAVLQGTGAARRRAADFVSIAPYRFFSPAAYGPGFLGPQYAPLVVGESQQSLIPIPGQQQHQLRGRAQGAGPRPARRASAPSAPTARVELLDEMQDDFLAKPLGRLLARAIAAPTSGP